MSNLNKNSNYTIIANLYNNINNNSQKNTNINNNISNYSTLVAYQNENTLDNLYILNQFQYDKNNTSILELLFSAYESSNKPHEYKNFFIENNNYYAVFKYYQYENIKTFFDKNFNDSHFNERCSILEYILIRIYNMNSLPNQIIGCLTELENIVLNKDKDVLFQGNLKNLSKYSDSKTSKKLIFKNIHDIIYTILEPECSMGFNKPLHIILDKCKNLVFESIPELIVELKKAEKLSQTSSWKSYIKYHYELRKPIIQKLSKTAVSSALILGVFYLAYSKLTENTKSASSSALVTIGDTSYNANSEDTSDKNVSIENIDNQSGDDDTANITLSKGLDMEYEDYIVQYGDTISSIAMSYYKENKYATAISTFNGLEVTDKLTAGTILKLPNRTAIALYLSR